MPSFHARPRPLAALAAAFLLTPTAVSIAAPPRKPTPTPTPAPTPTPTPSSGSVQLLITDPAPGTVLAGNRYNIRGTLVAPINTGVTVNDEIAYTGSGRFVLNDVALSPGTNTILAIATAATGEAVSVSTQVEAGVAPPVLSLRADVSAGIAPLPVTFSFTFTPPSSVTVASAAIDFDGDGRFDYQNRKTPLQSVQNVYSQPGLYLARLKIVDANRLEYTADLGIEVVSLDELDTLFASVWDAMNGALLQRDVSRARTRLNARAAEAYAPIFQELLPDMPTIIASYSRPQRVSVRRDVLEYAVNRTVRGEDRIFFVYLARDADGVWRIDSM